MTPDFFYLNNIAKRRKIEKIIVFQFKLFLVNIPVLYPLKTLGNILFSCVCMRCKMGTLARNGLGSAGRHVVMRKWLSFKVAAT